LGKNRLRFLLVNGEGLPPVQLSTDGVLFWQHPAKNVTLGLWEWPVLHCLLVGLG
jgi:hypothetical protein